MGYIFNNVMKCYMISWNCTIFSGSFSLENGTAVSPEDFPASLATSVTFNIGDNNGKTKQVLVPIEDDDIVEPVQSFQVQLVTQENIIDPGAATIQIIDNDGKVFCSNEL